MMNKWEEHFKNAQEKFKNHRAKLVQDGERITVIDWRNADGRSDYYINFIVDKKRGSLIVSGDLGDSIATWYNPLTIGNLKSYIYKDIGYYMSKFQCTSDRYFYEEDHVFECLLDDLQIECMEDYIAYSEFDDYEDFEKNVKEEICNSIRGDEFIPTDRLYEIVTDIYPDAWECLHNCGAQVHPRVYLWAIGFNMACDQLIERALI